MWTQRLRSKRWTQLLTFLKRTDREIPNRNKKQDRVKLSLLCLSGYAILLSLRFNLSVAIIEMTKKPKTETIHYECAINESIKQGKTVLRKLPNNHIVRRALLQENEHHIRASRTANSLLIK